MENKDLKNILVHPQTMPPDESLATDAQAPVASYGLVDNPSYIRSPITVHEAAGPEAVAPTPESVPPPKKRLSVRKSVVVSAIVTLFVTALTGVTLVNLARHAVPDSWSKPQIQTQDVNLENADLGNLPPELQGAKASLLVNGDVVVKGDIKISNGNFVTVIKAGGGNADQIFTLPTGSGTICLDTNNCSYVTNAQLQTQLGQLSGQGIPASSLVNNQEGPVLIQGVANQIGVVTSNGVIQIATPQDIALGSTPTFAGLILSGLDCSGNANGGALTAIGGAIICSDDDGGAGSPLSGSGTNGQVAYFNGGASLTSSGNFLFDGTDLTLANAGSEFRLLESAGGVFYGSIDVGDLSVDQTYTFPDASGTVCLSSGNCVGVGGTGDVLNNGQNGPLTVGTNNATSLTLETSNAARLVISSTGAVTIGGSVTAGSFSGDGSALTSLNGSNISSGTVNNSRLTNAGVLTVSAGNGLSGGGSVALGSSTSLSVAYGAVANTAVQGNTILNCATVSGNLSGGGGNITLGSGGSCAAIGLTATPTFTTVDATTFTGALVGNASTATALAANPTDCLVNQFANAIGANGNLSCAAITDADVPNSITVDLATTATALAANPTDCLVNQFANAIAANGNLSCGALTDADIPNSITVDQATTATALAANPSDCAPNQFANAIAANGNLSCAGIVDADVSDTLTASIFRGSGSTTDAIDLATAEIAGVLADANVSDTLTIGAASTVADGALSVNVSLLGQTIEGSEITNGTVANVDLANSSVTVTAGVGLTNGGGVALGSSVTLDLANTTVTANSYGSASSVATFTVDAQGRLTAAGNTAIAINGNQITSGTVGNSFLTNSGALTVTAGNGLTNGGSVVLGSSTTLDIGAGFGITVNPNDIAVNIEANKGLEADANGLSLIDCSNGQILKYNTSQWSCAADNDSGSGSVSSLNSFTGGIAIQGTANEIDIDNTSNVITIGLPNDVTIGNDLTVTNNATVTKTLAIGNSADPNNPAQLLASGVTASTSLDIEQTVTDLSSTDNVYGSSVQLLLNPSGPATSVIAGSNVSVQTDPSATNDFSNIFGSVSSVTHQGSTQAGALYGAYSNVQNDSTGDVAAILGGGGLASNNAGTNVLTNVTGTAGQALNGGTIGGALYGGLFSAQNSNVVSGAGTYGILVQSQNDAVGTLSGSLVGIANSVTNDGTAHSLYGITSALSNTGTLSGEMVGSYILMGQTGSVADMVGQKVTVNSLTASATSNQVGIAIGLSNQGSGTVSIASGLSIGSMTNTGGGSITDAYSAIMFGQTHATGKNMTLSLGASSGGTSSATLSLGASPSSGAYSIYNGSTALNLFKGQLSFSGVATDLTTDTNEDLTVVANGSGIINLNDTTQVGGALTVAGNILPATNDTYDLGSNTARWKDLFLGGDTLHVGTSTTDEGTVSYDTTNNVFQFGTDSTTNGDISFFGDDLYLDKSAGSIGIGTTTPQAQLHVSGTALGADLFRVTDGTATAKDVMRVLDGGAVKLQNQTDSTAAFQIQNAAGNTLLNADTTSMIIRPGVASSYTSTSRTITQLTTANNQGTPFNSIVIGTDGLPIIAMNDETTNDLVIVKCTTASCSSQTTATVSTPNNDGEYPSMTIGSDGLPIILSYDVTVTDPVITHCNDIACTSSTSTTLTDVDGAGTNGSIVIAPDGLPFLAYRNFTDTDLVLVKCANITCTSITASTQLTDTDNIGFAATVRIGSDGLPIVVTDNTTDTDLYVVKCINASCTTNTITKLVTSDADNSWASMVIGRNGLPIIASQDITAPGIEMTYCNDLACSTAQTHIISGTTNIGGSTSMALGSNGTPIISYYAGTGADLGVVACNDTLCTSATVTPFSDPDQIGPYNTLTLGADGNPIIAFYNLTDTDLMILKCVDATCASTSGNVFGGGATLGSVAASWHGFYVDTINLGRSDAHLILNELGDLKANSLLAEANGNVSTSGHLAVGLASNANSPGQLLYPGDNYYSVLSVEETVGDFDFGYVNGITSFLNLNPTNPVTSQFYGTDSEVVTQSGNVQVFDTVAGGYFRAAHGGTAAMTTGIGLQSSVQNLGSGTITDAMGLRTRVRNLSTGIIGSSYGLYVDSADNSGGGTLLTNTGVYIANQAGVGSTANYNLYSAGANSTNLFEGMVQLQGDIYQTSNGINGLGDSGSMIPNAGFELNSDGTPSAPDNWTFAQTVATATPSVTSTSPGQGDRSFQMTMSAATSEGTLTSACVPVSASTTYTLSLRLKESVSTTNAFDSFVDWYTSKANCIANSGATAVAGPAQAAAPGSTAWVTPTTANSTMGATATWARVRLRLGSAGAAITVTVDGVRLTPNAVTSGVDLAENFRTQSSFNLMPGELVSFGDSTEDGALAVRSTGPYDSKLMGIVSTQPGLTLDDGSGYEKVTVALAGRVPVKVSSENGAIAVGDPITASSVPGVGMKAATASQIIGYAMQDYSQAGEGSIIVMVSPGFWAPSVSQVLQSQQASFNSLQITGSANMANLNISGNANLANLTVQGGATFNGIVTVTGDTKVANLYVGGLLISKGQRPTITNGAALGSVLGAITSVNGTSTAGTVTIDVGANAPAGGELAEITFEHPYPSPPKIVLSGNNKKSAKSGAYIIRTTTGFKIVSDDALEANTTYQFDYIVIGAEN